MGFREARFLCIGNTTRSIYHNRMNIQTVCSLSTRIYKPTNPWQSRTNTLSFPFNPVSLHSDDLGFQSAAAFYTLKMMDTTTADNSAASADTSFPTNAAEVADPDGNVTVAEDETDVAKDTAVVPGGALRQPTACQHPPQRTQTTTYLNVAVLVGATVAGGDTVAVALIATVIRLLDSTGSFENPHNEFNAEAANGKSNSCGAPSFEIGRAHV